MKVLTVCGGAESGAGNIKNVGFVESTNQHSTQMFALVYLINCNYVRNWNVIIILRDHFSMFMCGGLVYTVKCTMYNV